MVHIRIASAATFSSAAAAIAVKPAEKSAACQTSAFQSARDEGGGGVVQRLLGAELQDTVQRGGQNSDSKVTGRAKE